MLKGIVSFNETNLIFLLRYYVSLSLFEIFLAASVTFFDKSGIVFRLIVLFVPEIEIPAIALPSLSSIAAPIPFTYSNVSASLILNPFF